MNTILDYIKMNNWGKLMLEDYGWNLFGHRKGKQIWILGAIDNTKRDFKLEAGYERDAVILWIEIFGTESTSHIEGFGVY